MCLSWLNDAQVKRKRENFGGLMMHWIGYEHDVHVRVLSWPCSSGGAVITKPTSDVPTAEPAKLPRRKESPETKPAEADGVETTTAEEAKSSAAGEAAEAAKALAKPDEKTSKTGYSMRPRVQTNVPVGKRMNIYPKPSLSAQPHELRRGGLYIMRSTIPNAGFGLYADKPFRKGGVISVYNGRVVPEEEAGKHTHSMVTSTGETVDGRFAWEDGDPLTSYANTLTASNKKTLNLRINSAFRDTGRDIELVATANIPMDAEIFVDYGKSWKHAI